MKWKRRVKRINPHEIREKKRSALFPFKILIRQIQPNKMPLVMHGYIIGILSWDGEASTYVFNLCRGVV